MSYKLTWRTNPTQMLLKASYICPQCFSVRNITYPAESIFKAKHGQKIQKTTGLEGAACDITHDVKCRHCNMSMVECDTEIARYIGTISDLLYHNSNHFQVLGSSIGHHIEIDPWNVPKAQMLYTMPFLSLKGNGVKLDKLVHRVFDNAHSKYPKIDFDSFWFECIPFDHNEDDPNYMEGEIIETIYPFKADDYLLPGYPDEFKSYRRAFIKYLETFIDTLKLNQ